MHVPNLKHELGVSLHIMPQIFIGGIRKVTKFAPRNVVGVPWNKFRLEPLLEELPYVTVVLPVTTPLWPSVGVNPNTPKVGDLESSGTPECLGFHSKAQNTSH